MEVRETWPKVHGSEILAIDVHGDHVASGARDRKVVIKIHGMKSWTKTITDHAGAVTQVRFMGGEGATKNLLFSKGEEKLRGKIERD